MNRLRSRFHARLGTFRQLEIFMTFAETGSISETSKILHLAQPSVSIQLKKLAESIDVMLLEQVGRKLFLTDAGKELYQSSLEIFGTIDRLESRLASLSGLQAGKLKLSVVTTAKYFFPHLLGPFCKKYPKIDVQFNIGNRGSIIERLRKNLDDFYVFSYPPKDMDIVTNEFIDNPLVVVASKDHPFAEKDKISFEALKSEPFIMREEGSGTRHAIEKFLAEGGFEVNHKMTIESNEAIKHSVMSDLGISILSVHTLFQERNDNISILNVEGFPRQHKWYIVHLKNKQFSDVARTFLQYLNIDGAIIARQLLKESSTTQFIDSWY